MDRRVHVYGKAKESSSGAVAKASLKMALSRGHATRNLSDLPVARVNVP